MCATNRRTTSFRLRTIASKLSWSVLARAWASERVLVVDVPFPAPETSQEHRVANLSQPVVVRLARASRRTSPEIIDHLGFQHPHLQPQEHTRAVIHFHLVSLEARPWGPQKTPGNLATELSVCVDTLSITDYYTFRADRDRARRCAPTVLTVTPRTVRT